MQETRLPISFALASNKTVAKIGTGQAKPNGQLEIPAGTEKEFLAPLSIRKIPGLGKKAYEVLSGYGIEKISQLQALNPQALIKLLGEHGITYWHKANGVCESEIEAYGDRKSISTECTFAHDTYDIEHLRRVMVNMVEKVAYQMRSEDLISGCACVKLRYSNFSTFSMQASIPHTSVDTVMIDKVKQLFDKLYDRNKPIRLIGVRFANLLHGSPQIDLFNDTSEQMQLSSALDKLKQKFGEEVIMRATSIDLNKRDSNFFRG